MDLKPQEPAEGIMQTYNYPNFRTYHIECACADPDDAIDFIVEESHGEIVIQTSTTQKTSWWDDPFKKRQSFDIKSELLFNINYYVRGFLNALAHRLCITWDVWVKGHVKYSQTTIMTPQQAINYSNVLQQAVEQVQSYKKNHE